MSAILYQLFNNIGHDESITFRRGRLGLEIRRTAKCGDLRLDRIISKLEIETAKFPDDLVAEALLRMAIELQGVPKS